MSDRVEMLDTGGDECGNPDKWAHRRGDEYCVVVTSVIGNQDHWDFEHYAGPERFGTLNRAIKSGFEDYDRSDDFNIGVYRWGMLTAVLWMDEIIAQGPDLAEYEGWL